MIHQFLNKDSKTNWGYIIGYFILFLIAPPFIAIPTIIVYMVTNPMRLNLIIICVSLLLQVILQLLMPRNVWGEINGNIMLLI